MQFDFFDVQSPCIGVCKNDEKGYCTGCFRNRQERFDWNTFTNDEKQKVIKNCERRRKRKNAKPKEEQVIEQPAPEQASLFDQPSKDVDLSEDMDFGDFEL